MLLPHPSLPLLLIHFFALALTTPIDPPTPFSPLKNPLCSNSPAHHAGTPFTRRSLRLLPPRTAHSVGLPPRQRGQSVVVCAAPSSTWINLLMGGYIYPQDMLNMLTLAINTLTTRIAESGDTYLTNGRFVGSAGIGPGVQLVLRAVNVNNHQTTRGVLRAALVALRAYMAEWGYGEVFLQIWDGDNMVGKASMIVDVVGG